MLSQWAADWQIPLIALHDLQRRMGLRDAAPVEETAGESEAAVSNRVRLEAARLGMRLWRNNVGVLEDQSGRPVRYGLANDSPAVNRVIKSADLIGIRPVRIGPQHLGELIGKFVSYECKRGDWRYTGTAREQAQADWATLVLSLGGEARFVNRTGLL